MGCVLNEIHEILGEPNWLGSSAPTGESMGLFERKPLRRALHNWRLRHQHPFNFAIHLIGIPLAVTGVVLFLVWPWEDWYWGVGAFVFGYVLQWLGHKVEGNDLGEWAAIKRFLGMQYIGIAPQYEQRSTSNSPS